MSTPWTYKKIDELGNESVLSIEDTSPEYQGTWGEYMHIYALVAKAAHVQVFGDSQDVK